MKAVLVCIASLLSLVAEDHFAVAGGTASRVEIPISQIRLSNGELRYSILVSIGGSVPIDAMLDTGSFGLRVMSRALSHDRYAAASIVRDYPYGSGVVLHGPLAHAIVNIGDVTTGTPIFIQVVESVACGPMTPRCPASRVSPQDYEIGGDGLAGQGFEAILGISMIAPQTPEAAINPLAFVGDQKWIVILPRPDDRKPGQLIVNPATSDLGFQLAPASHSNELPPALAGGSAMAMDSGARNGLAPFFRYAILFDLKHRAIGVKPRRDDD